MPTLQVKISESDLKRYNLNGAEIKFADFVEKINLEFARKSLRECTELAEQVGLSKMTMEEINAEIKIVRDAKANS